MMTEHKATPEQWDDVGAFASDTRACILELRARVEALEATSKPSPNSSQIGSSLVERVTAAIGRDGETARWQEARAAIREVAYWLHAAGIWEAADVLEREAGR
jgi:hypothetical protein